MSDKKLYEYVIWNKKTGEFYTKRVELCWSDNEEDLRFTIGQLNPNLDKEGVTVSLRPFDG